MVRINRVYTRTGDAGTTRLVGGQEVSKTDLRLEAYGTLDELNAQVGVARVALGALSHDLARQVDETLGQVQHALFDLGAELACLPEDVTETMPLVGDAATDALEARMDALNEDLPDLTSFVLPGGGAAAAALHVGRTVARRAERIVVALGQTSEVRPTVLSYLNRLSDYLFVASRAATVAAGEDEVLWRPGGGTADT